MKEFSSFGAFARHLAVTAALGEEVTHHIAEKSAEIIKQDAQAKLGHYQESVGPFPEWAELADSTKADRLAQGFTENDPLRRTGGLADSIQTQVLGNDAVVGSEDPVARWQEEGTERIPPRPFLGPAAFGAKRPISEMAGKTIIAWVSGLGWKRPQIELP
jgi:phage gpG-like protein